MIAPEWATELLLQVCKDEGRSKKPKLSWGYSKSKYRRGSSGHFEPWSNTIRVMDHEYSTDQRQVFLHEICHWLIQPRGKSRAVHGKRFYLKLSQLLSRYDCLTQEYREREARYMKRSVNYL